MTAPTGAYVFRNCSVMVNSVDVSNQITKVRLVPDTPIQTLRVMVPNSVVQDVDETAWTLEMSGVQDWTNSTGIADVLNDNAGSQITVVMAPANTTGKVKATVTIVATPVDFGGETGSFNTFDMTFAVVGVPTFSTVS